MMHRHMLAPLCAALLAVSLLAGCAGQEASSSAAPASSAGSKPASSAASVPRTPAEIVIHNDKIDPEDIRLLQFDPPAADAQYATIKTELGEIKLVLFPSEAPKAVENFTALVKDGFYNGMSISEVVPEVRIGAGATDANGVTGKSASGTPFADEPSLNLWHFTGALAMNNGSIPDANDSRFYIVQNSGVARETMDAVIDGGFPQKVIDKYFEVGGVPNYDFHDTVFGQVVEGMDVVEQIAQVERGALNKPKTDIQIQAIELS